MLKSIVFLPTLFFLVTIEEVEERAAKWWQITNEGSLTKYFSLSFWILFLMIIQKIQSTFIWSKPSPSSQDTCQATIIFCWPGFPMKASPFPLSLLSNPSVLPLWPDNLCQETCPPYHTMYSTVMPYIYTVHTKAPPLTSHIGPGYTSQCCQK